MAGHVAGRLVLAHVVDLPALPATATLSLKGGVQADELIGMTESTDPIRGERVITAIANGAADVRQDQCQGRERGWRGRRGQAVAVAGYRYP